MLVEKKKNINIGTGLGFIIRIAGNILQLQGGALVAIGFLVVLAGLAVFIWGCMNYCEGKGHSKWSELLGLLSIIGLLILILLPDRHKNVA